MDHIRLSTTLPATPKAVYDAWLSSQGHTAMTGARATSEPRVGARHTAWDGYISGEHVQLEPAKRILQTWRTTEFPTTAPDSLLEVALAAAPEGTRLTLTQSGIPDGQGEQYHEGWQDHYFAPMRAYFATMKPETRAKKAAGPAKGAKKAKAGGSKAATRTRKKAKAGSKAATRRKATAGGSKAATRKRAKPAGAKGVGRPAKKKPAGRTKATKTKK